MKKIHLNLQLRKKLKVFWMKNIHVINFETYNEKYIYYKVIK